MIEFGSETPDRQVVKKSVERVEAFRRRGGILVEAVRITRMPMVVTDPTLTGNPIVFANNAFLAMSGYGQDEVLTTAEREGRFETESWRVRKDGSRFWAHVRLAVRGQCAVEPAPVGSGLGQAQAALAPKYAGEFLDQMLLGRSLGGVLSHEGSEVENERFCS